MNKFFGNPCYMVSPHWVSEQTWPLITVWHSAGAHWASSVYIWRTTELLLLLLGSSGSCGCRHFGLLGCGHFSAWVTCFLPGPVCVTKWVVTLDWLPRYSLVDFFFYFACFSEQLLQCQQGENLFLNEAANISELTFHTASQADVHASVLLCFQGYLDNHNIQKS